MLDRSWGSCGSRNLGVYIPRCTATSQPHAVEITFIIMATAEGRYVSRYGGAAVNTGVIS